MSDVGTSRGVRYTLWRLVDHPWWSRSVSSRFVNDLRGSGCGVAAVTGPRRALPRFNTRRTGTLKGTHPHARRARVVWDVRVGWIGTKLWANLIRRGGCDRIGGSRWPKHASWNFVVRSVRSKVAVDAIFAVRCGGLAAQSVWIWCAGCDVAGGFYAYRGSADDLWRRSARGDSVAVKCLVRRRCTATKHTTTALSLSQGRNQSKQVTKQSSCR